MSKITFRADDDLVAAVDDLEASKSEVMRDALRAYLHDVGEVDAVAASISDTVTERVDDLVEHQLGAQQASDRDVNVRITLEAGEGVRADAGQPERGRGPAEESGRQHSGGRGGAGQGGERDPRQDPGREAVHGAGRGHGHDPRNERKRPGEQTGTACTKCGETVSPDHVYCPNCGEKATRRLFCECGDEVRSDWAFCPHCGRRTASADALDR
jgi:RNA polymerase subunit RPABC4/transcription elongation factor Spt4